MATIVERSRLLRMLHRSGDDASARGRPYSAGRKVNESINVVYRASPPALPRATPLGAAHLDHHMHVVACQAWLAGDQADLTGEGDDDCVPLEVQEAVSIGVVS